MKPRLLIPVFMTYDRGILNTIMYPKHTHTVIYCYIYANDAESGELLYEGNEGSGGTNGSMV